MPSENAACRAKPRIASDGDLANADERSFGDRVLSFWEQAVPPIIETLGIEVMDPRSDDRSRTSMESYYRRFYSGPDERIFMIGINPGRFGGGITGIPFTDPVALRDDCGIENSFDPRRELSSEYIYQFIRRYGGMTGFGQDFYLTAACPFGLIRGGKNINYYDLPPLQRELEPYIIETMEQQIALGARRDVAIVIGTGKNAAVLEKLNASRGWFDRIAVLEHPRFIMQYRRRRLDEYLNKYVELCQSLIGSL